MIDELRPFASPIARPIEPALYEQLAELVRASDAVVTSNRIAEENQGVIDSLVRQLGDQLVDMCPCHLGSHLIEARRVGRHGIEVSVTLVRTLTPTHRPSIYPRPRAS